MPGQNLTKLEAQERAAIVSEVSYTVSLKLRPKGDTFISRTEVDFKASEGASTFIDLIAAEVVTVELNGEKLNPTQVYSDSRIKLEKLKIANRLVIEAHCHYMHTGEGLHRFTDPADGFTYVYTQFEVPDARRVYACFEQPDLKATYQFNVNVPKSWIVLSNQIMPEPEGGNCGCECGQVFRFPRTLPISTYITAIVAGPYYGVRDELISADGRKIPLGVYCRQSLREYLDADFVLSQTKAGFKFYEREFNRVYPFENYDQIFVPEYNAGAMENAGCVTFRDEYVFRSKPSEAQLQTFSNTILHELAHMWFGDLVTMKWWDDLWLNESFAEFMAYLSMAEGTQFTDAWTGFGIRKMWGLNCDQMPTTHPIVAPINDLADVEVNFDGITYSKGACVLRQLVYYVGRKEFMKALNNYFDAHGYANATLADLLKELEKTSGRDLQSWTKSWLLEAGITRLDAEIERNNEGVVQHFLIKQSLPQEGTSLRPHRLVVGAYDFDEAGKLVRKERVETDVAGEISEVPELMGTSYPVYVLNDEDIAYAKIRFDTESQKIISQHIDTFADSMPRMVILCAAWDAMRDGDMSATDFINLALKALKNEENSTVLGGLIRFITSAATYYAADDNIAAAKAAAGLLALAEAAEEGSGRQRQLFRGFLSLASEKYTEQLKAWYETEKTLPGIEVDTDLKWDLMQAQAQTGAVGEKDIAQQLESDKTITGHEKAMQAQATLANKANKQTWMERIYIDTKLSNGQLSHAISGFYSGVAKMEELADLSINTYFAKAKKIWESRTLHMAEGIILGMYPLRLVGRVATDIVSLTEQWLADNSDAPRALQRKMRENLDAARRAIKGQAKDKN